MTLATFSDANQWLDGTKIKFLDAADASPEATSIDTIVRSALKDLYPDNYDQWDESGAPEETPALVREAASLLMASMRYAKKYSEETLAESEYAARLWALGMELIDGLRSGKYQLDDKPYSSVTLMGSADFYPNDSTVNEDGEPLRMFAVEQEF